MSQQNEPQRAGLAFVLFAVFIDSLGFGIVMPVLPDFLEHLTGQTLSQVSLYSGLITATFAVAQFLFGPFIGNLSDRFGRRPILLMSMFGFAVNYTIMALAPSLFWLFLGRGLAGISGAIFGPANAFIADTTTPENRARGFGMVGAAFGLGFVVGPAIGGVVGTMGPRAPFYAAAALAISNAVFGYFVLKESLPLARRRAFSLARANPLGALLNIGMHRGVLPIIGAIFLLMTSIFVFPTTWSFFAKMRFGWSPLTIGLSLAFVGFTMVVVQGFLLGRIVKRFGERRSAITGLLASSVGMMAFAWATKAWMVFAIQLISSLQALASPSLNALASQRTAPNAQGELQGTIASANGLGTILGPLLFSFALSFATAPERVHPFDGAAFVLASAFGFIALLLVFFSSVKSFR